MDKFTCKHFCGLRDKKCNAGVAYNSVTPRPGEPGCALRIPCMLPDKFKERMSPRQIEAMQEKGTCEKFELPTDAEIAEHEAAIKAVVDRHTKMAPWIRDMRMKHRKEGFRGVVECPVCKGRLHFTVSNYNGHTSGRCESENCVNYIE
jgi:hypothetical protein